MVWCSSPAEERPKIVRGAAQLLLAMMGIFVVFAILATTDAMDWVARSERAARQRRRRLVRQVEERQMYWEEVDPRGRFDVCTRTIQKLKREERARRRKWAVAATDSAFADEFVRDAKMAAIYAGGTSRRP